MTKPKSRIKIINHCGSQRVRDATMAELQARSLWFKRRDQINTALNELRNATNALDNVREPEQLSRLLTGLNVLRRQTDNVIQVAQTARG